MPGRNGSKARAKASFTPSRTIKEIKPLFEYLFDGAKYEYVDLFCCIPFKNIWTTTQYGVIKSFHIYDWTSTINDSGHSIGLELGTDTPMVLPLIGSLEHFLYEHLKKSCLSGDELTEKFNSRPKWIRIVNGMHSNLDIRLLITNRPTFKYVTWFVSVIRGGFSTDKYMQLSRFQNHHHSPKYNIPLTFYDKFNNLRSAYDRLS